MALPRHARRGNYAVIFALALTGILGFCALALDYSRIVISEVQLQHTADASALAATTMLRDFDGDVNLAFFVSPNGSDRGTGSRTSPFRTIQRGIDAASASGTAWRVSTSLGIPCTTEQLCVILESFTSGPTPVAQQGAPGPTGDGGASADASSDVGPPMPGPQASTARGSHSPCSRKRKCYSHY